MQLTRYTDYSLRVLIYLSVNLDRKVTIKEISTSFKISKNHCTISPVCELQSILGSALNAFLKTLDIYTLADKEQ